MIPTHIIIHHSLTKDGQVVDWQAIRRYHVEDQGWKDIGYHFGIEKINNRHEVIVGRMWDQVGAHCKESGMNNHSLGICLIGNFDLAPPSAEQMDLLVTLCLSLQGTFRIFSRNVLPHRVYAPYKSCPGTKFPWLDFLARLPFKSQ